MAAINSQMRIPVIILLMVLSASSHAEFSGRLKGEEEVFLQHQTSPVPQAETSLQIELEEHQVFWDSWKIKAEPRVRLSSAPRMTDSPIDGDLRDTLIEKKFSSYLHVQAGSFIKAWEGTDGLNPMDIASVRNYRDPVSADSIGSVGVALGGSFSEHFTWDALYVPWQTPTRLPGSNSPWWPRQTSLPLEANNAQLLLPTGGPQINVDHHETLNRALNDNIGGRAQFHGGSWDISAAMFEGAAQIPIFQPIINGDLIATVPKQIIRMSNPVEIRPIEYRRRTYAGSMVNNQQSWIFRLAGRYDQPIGNTPLLPGWSDQVVAGVEKTFNIHSQTVVLVTEFAYEDQAAASETILSSQDPFRRAILMGVRLPYSDDLLFYASGLMDVQKSSSIARINVQKKFGGHWSVEGTGEWIRGNDDSLLGLWKNQSRVIAGGTFQF